MSCSAWSRLLLLSISSACSAQTLQELKSDARNLFTAGQLEASEIAWSKVLSKWPQDTDALLNYGVIEDMLGRYANASRYLENAAHRQPSSSQVLNNLAINLVHLDRKPEAIKTLEKSLRIDGANPTALDNLGTLYFGASRWPDAIRSWDKLLSIEPDNPGLHEKLSIAHTRFAQQLLRDKKLEESLTEFQTATELDPNDPEPYLGATIALLRGGENQGALSVVKEAGARLPRDLRITLATGYVYEALEDWPSAVHWYQAAIDLSPKSTDALISLGRALRENGDSQSAIVELRGAVALDPQSASAAFELGNSLLLANSSQAEAIEWLTRAAALAPERAEPHYLLAKCALENNQLAKASALAEAALKADPNFAPAHYLLSQIYRRQNKNSAAKLELEAFGRLNTRVPAKQSFDPVPANQ